MGDYVLYYHAIPFRGHFIRYVLAHAGAAWEEAAPEEVMRLRVQDVGAQPWPMMAPPMLHDRGEGLWLSQMPAILAWLGQRHGLMPGDARGAAMTLKVIGDADDVLEEITRDCGARMWDRAAWEDFSAGRLMRWVEIFEETGRRHGLGHEDGFLLGGAAPGLADLATAALWHTMVDRLPPLRAPVTARGPRLMALADRIAALPEIAAMRAGWDARMGGESWCGGQIEASLRAMTGS